MDETVKLLAGIVLKRELADDEDMAAVNDELRSHQEIVVSLAGEAALE